MATRKIVVLGKEGGEVLSKKCKPVDKFDDRLAELIDDLNETLAHHDGYGLAAPQVGVLKRVVVISYEDKTLELVNPVIVKTAGSSIDDEGCLSVEEERGLVKRPDYVKVEFFDRAGKKQVAEANGYFARVFFHELDHLDGILFVDKMLRDKKGLPYTYKDLKKGLIKDV